MEDFLVDDSSTIIIDDDINATSNKSSNKNDQIYEETGTENNHMDTTTSVGIVDFVLAADVVYGYDKDSGNKRQDTFHALVQSFLDLCHKQTIIILAYKIRRPSEHIFFDMMSNKFESTLLDPTLLHSDFSTSDMNIYLFRLKRN